LFEYYVGTNEQMTGGYTFRFISIRYWNFCPFQYNIW